MILDEGTFFDVLERIAKALERLADMHGVRKS
jgi:hypothetical protein